MSDTKVRDHLANERTFLAWVRTAIALMGFGVVVAKLRFIFLTQLPGNTTVPLTSGTRSTLLGLAFVAVGLLTLIFAGINFRQTQQMIETENFKPIGTTLLVFSGVIFCLGFACLVYLLKL